MRRWWATAWALALLLPFAVALGFPTADWLFAYAAAVFFLGASRFRLPLRVALLVLSLVAGADLGGAGALATLAAMVAHLSPTHWGQLSRSEGVALFEVASVAATSLFELRSSGPVRLAEFLLGMAALAIAQEAGAVVAPFIAAFLALVVPVVRSDRSHGGKAAIHGSMWLFSGVLALIACLIAFSLPQTRVAFAFQTGRANGGVPIDPTNLNLQVSQSSQVVFTATSTVDGYWRVFSADTYTGQGWNHQPPGRDYLPGDLQMPNPFGSGGREGTATVHLRKVLAEDPAPGIPMGPLYPVKTGASHQWIIDLSGDGFTIPGAMHYTVLFGYPTASAAQLQAAAAAGGPAVDLAVPPKVAARLKPLTLRIVAGAGPSPYERVKAIAAWLDSHEQYTLSMPSDGGQDFVTYFLFTSHQGDCNAFSSALALMARTIGIPTRWVAGYTPGHIAGHRYEVLASDAHSWVEVNYAGIGWVPIDPTPGFTQAVVPPPLAGGNPAPQIQPQTGSGPTPVRNRQVPPGVLRSLRQVPPHQSHARRPKSATSPWPFAAALIVALGAVREALSWRRPAWLMAATRLTGRPWRRGMTVREWLGGEAPALQELMERRIYGVSGNVGVRRAEAGRELRRFFRRSRRLGVLLSFLVSVPWPG